MGASISFVPAKVAGIGGIESVTIYPDRICFTMKPGEEIIHSFEQMARTQRRKEQPWWKRVFPQRGDQYVGERDFCREDRYFRWFTEPPITIFTPPDPEDAGYEETWFYKIHEVMWEGRYRTWDLGQHMNSSSEQAVADQRAAAPQLNVLVNVQPLTMIRSGAPSSA